MAVGGVGGEATGEGVVASFVREEGEAGFGKGEADFGLRHASAFEVGLAHLGLFEHFFVHHDEAVRDGAWIDEGDFDGPVFGHGEVDLAVGVAIEVHAVVGGGEGGDEGELDGLGLVSQLHEVGLGDAGEEFFFKAWYLDDGVIMTSGCGGLLGE